MKVQKIQSGLYFQLGLQRQLQCRSPPQPVSFCGEPRRWVACHLCVRCLFRLLRELQLRELHTGLSL